MPYLGLICLALVAFCFYLQWQKDGQIDALLKEQALERDAWATERRDLNNRIQVPEAAPYMEPASEAAPTPQYVPFDDDEAFHRAEEEMAEWP